MHESNRGGKISICQTILKCLIFRVVVEKMYQNLKNRGWKSIGMYQGLVLRSAYVDREPTPLTQFTNFILPSISFHLGCTFHIDVWS